MQKLSSIYTEISENKMYIGEPCGTLKQKQEIETCLILHDLQVKLQVGLLVSFRLSSCSVCGRKTAWASRNISTCGYVTPVTQNSCRKLKKINNPGRKKMWTEIIILQWTNLCRKKFCSKYHFLQINSICKASFILLEKGPGFLGYNFYVYFLWRLAYICFSTEKFQQCDCFYKQSASITCYEFVFTDNVFICKYLFFAAKLQLWISCAMIPTIQQSTLGGLPDLMMHSQGDLQIFVFQREIADFLLFFLM